MTRYYCIITRYSYHRRYTHWNCITLGLLSTINAWKVDIYCHSFTDPNAYNNAWKLTLVGPIENGVWIACLRRAVFYGGSILPTACSCFFIWLIFSENRKKWILSKIILKGLFIYSLLETASRFPTPMGAQCRLIYERKDKELPPVSKAN